MVWKQNRLRTLLIPAELLSKKVTGYDPVREPVLDTGLATERNGFIIS